MANGIVSDSMVLARDLCHSTSAKPLCSSSFCFAKFLFQWFFFFRFESDEGSLR